MPPQWEYRWFFRFDELEAAGLEGWEVVNFYVYQNSQGDDEIQYFCKRPIDVIKVEKKSDEQSIPARDDGPKPLPS